MCTSTSATCGGVHLSCNTHHEQPGFLSPLWSPRSAPCPASCGPQHARTFPAVRVHHQQRTSCCEQNLFTKKIKALHSNIWLSFTWVYLRSLQLFINVWLYSATVKSDYFKTCPAYGQEFDASIVLNVWKSAVAHRILVFITYFLTKRHKLR